MKIRARHVGTALGVGALALTVVLHRGPLLHPGDVLHAVALADRWWLLLAAAAQFASLAAFAEQHRYLLRKFGGAISLRRSIGVTLARTSISVTVPGGAAVSTAYAIRQFRARGVSSGAAAAVTVLAGLQAVGTLLLVYLAWFSTVGLTAGHSFGLGTAATAAGVLLAVVLGPASADHCTHLTDADVEALAGGTTVATLLPGVEFSTRHPYPDARRLLDAGVRVALASDCNPGSCYTSSLPLCVALAVREMGMTPAEAVHAATAGGAAALGRDDVGSLTPGKRADLVLLEAPTHVHLAYRPGVPLVSATWVAGRPT